MKFMCENLTLIMNLHSFVWKKKHTHVFGRQEPRLVHLYCFSTSRESREVVLGGLANTCRMVKPSPPGPDGTVTVL